MSASVALERRLASWRIAHPGAIAAPTAARVPAGELAERLARAVDGEVSRGARGTLVRVEPSPARIPVDRVRLAGLPGQPPPGAPLVCLDTETTGLGTAAGTLAFLVGLGWWHGSRFEQLQLLLPDHADEPALLDALAAALPPDAWLVTYNGRGFDWPLLVARYRLDRRDAPALGGHLDLLTHVRRLFRHRLGDARLATVERHLLGVHRDADIAGWEIPERYLAFVRGGPPQPLMAVVEHNAEDVRSLARLLLHLDTRYADADRRPLAPAGDLVALARGYTRARQHAVALDCLEEADAGWLPPTLGSAAWPYGAPAPSPVTVSRERIRAERARTLRRLGRPAEAAAAWEALARAGGPGAASAWVEVAKLREHLLGDVPGALEASRTAARLLERARLLGAPEPGMEGAVAERGGRLRGRIERLRGADDERHGRQPGPGMPPLSRAGVRGAPAGSAQAGGAQASRAGVRGAQAGGAAAGGGRPPGR